MASVTATARCGEEWRPVCGWERLYEVSSDGRVRSLDRVDWRGQRYRGRMLTLNVKSGGYLTVGLCDNGEHRTRAIHRLVAEAFLGPRPDGCEVRHLDGDPKNNRLANLAYGSPSENSLDRVRHGTDYNAGKTHCMHGHLFDDANTYIHPNGHRQCRACSNESKRRSLARLRARGVSR